MPTDSSEQKALNLTESKESAAELSARVWSEIPVRTSFKQDKPLPGLPSTFPSADELLSSLNRPAEKSGKAEEENNLAAPPQQSEAEDKKTEKSDEKPNRKDAKSDSKSKEEDDEEAELRKLLDDHAKGKFDKLPKESKDEPPEKDWRTPKRPDAKDIDLTNDSSDQIIDFLKNKKQDIDYSKMITKDKPVLFLGERHDNADTQKHVADQAANFQKAGVTHFALEQINADMQPTLDKYFKGDADARKEILEHLNEKWGNSYPGSGERYMKILDAMKEKGIKPLGMDSHNHSGDFMAERNKSWADVLGKTIKNNPEARIVALGGMTHVGIDSNTADGILKKDYGVKSSTAKLMGGSALVITGKPTDSEVSLRDNESYTNVIARLAKKAGVDDQAFMVPVNKSGTADFHIHLPTRRNK